MSFRSVLEGHMNALPVSIVKKILSKYNKELDIRGYSKMSKAQVIAAVKAKKPMDKTLLAKLTKEAEGERKKRGDNVKAAPKAAPKKDEKPPIDRFRVRRQIASAAADAGKKRAEKKAPAAKKPKKETVVERTLRNFDEVSSKQHKDYLRGVKINQQERDKRKAKESKATAGKKPIKFKVKAKEPETKKAEPAESAKSNIPSGKETPKDEELTKKLKAHFKQQGNPYGGGDFKILNGKIHVDQQQYDHIGDTIPDSRANFSRDDWIRQSKKFGIKEGKIAPKPKETLKGYTTHKVLEDEDGKKVQVKGRTVQIKGKIARDRWAQKPSVNTPFYFIPRKDFNELSADQRKQIPAGADGIFSTLKGRQKYMGRLFVLEKRGLVEFG